jgi:hypothetical protein
VFQSVQNSNYKAAKTGIQEVIHVTLPVSVSAAIRRR